MDEERDDSMFEERQQEARNYLATLVKLSDSFVLLDTKQSETDDSKLAEEMIDSLLQVLREIVYNARYILPYQSLNSRRRPRESLHSSMDNLVTSSASKFDIVQRSAIRRSFRTLKKRITNSSSILRQTSI